MKLNYFHGIVASLSLCTSAHAAISFTEDFSSLSAGPNLVVTGGSVSDIDFSAATARFTGTDPTGSGRAYLGTNTVFDLGIDFVVEVEVTIPLTGGGNNVAFFGFGSGQRGVSTPAPSYYEPSDGPAAYIAVIGDGFSAPSNAKKIAYADLDSAVTGGTAGTIFKSGGLDVLLGSGDHRLRMTYTATSGLLEFAYQEDSIGSFINLGPALDISDNGFDSSTGQVFFGGSGSSEFDNLSVTVVPEPSQAILLCLSALLFAGRRRK